MQKQFLILLDGMTGSGKTTTASFIFQKLPRTAWIGMDKVKRFISDFEKGKRDNKIAKDIIFEMTKKYLELGISVIVDQPVKDEEELAKYENLVKEFGVECYKFQLFTTPEIAFNRVKERQGKKDPTTWSTDERIKNNITYFKKRDAQGFICIDTTNLNEKEASDLILKEIANA